MTKPLSEMLEASEPHAIAKNATLVPRESYDRMKRVAIELARACASARIKNSEALNGMCRGFLLEAEKDIRLANDSLDCTISRAKDIIGEVKHE